MPTPTPQNPVIKRCPHCRNKYTLGVDGVEDGCDSCCGIVRNPLDGSIVVDYETEIEQRLEKFARAEE